MALTGPVRQVGTAPTKAAGDRGTAADRDLVDGRRVAGRGQHRNALAVLHDQDRDRRAAPPVHHRLQREAGNCRRGAAGRRPAEGGRRRCRAAMTRAPTTSARSAAAASGCTREGADRQEHRRHGRRDSGSLGRRAPVEAESRKTPATMPITIGIGIASMVRLHPAERPSEEHQQAGGDVGADHLRGSQVVEGGGRPGRCPEWSRRTPAAGARRGCRRC